MSKAKSFNIPKTLIFAAYTTVKENRGAAGVDEISIKEFDRNQKDNLYKIWNRMSAGTYFPKPVKSVEIPKKAGGTRVLGVPTVEDRVAQMAVKMSIEPHINACFLKDSYGYRPNKSAHDAITVTRKRCWEYNWVLEFDIKGLFDNIDHELLMKAVRKHVDKKWELLYIQRWLQGPIQRGDGAVGERNKGTPQGGVISPLLANLFLHYAFDKWMEREFPQNSWCRYADDGIIHCKSEKQANYILKRLIHRLKECKLEIHEDKTKIVYCKDSNRRGNHPNIEFTFLGYTFRPRKAKTSNGNSFTSFLPAISKEAKKHIKRTIKSWYLLHQPGTDIENLSKKYNAAIRGWMNYYGLYGKAELTKVLRHLNHHLLMWVIRKYDKFKRKKRKAMKYLYRIAITRPHLFYHWSVGILPMPG